MRLICAGLGAIFVWAVRAAIKAELDDKPQSDRNEIANNPRGPAEKCRQHGSPTNERRHGLRERRRPDKSRQPAGFAAVMEPLRHERRGRIEKYQA